MPWGPTSCQHAPAARAGGAAGLLDDLHREDVSSGPKWNRIGFRDDSHPPRHPVRGVSLLPSSHLSLRFAIPYALRGGATAPRATSPRSSLHVYRTEQGTPGGAVAHASRRLESFSVVGTGLGRERGFPLARSAMRCSVSREAGAYADEIGVVTGSMGMTRNGGRYSRVTARPRYSAFLASPLPKGTSDGIGVLALPVQCWRRRWSP